MTEADLAKTLRNLNADCEDAQANGTPATDEFNRMARTICYAYRTGQLIVAQAGDVEAVAMVMHHSATWDDWEDAESEREHYRQLARAAIAAIPSLAAKEQRCPNCSVTYRKIDDVDAHIKALGDEAWPTA